MAFVNLESPRRFARRGGISTDPSCKEGTIVGFKAAKLGIEHFPPRNDDDVQSRGELVATKDLARQSLGPVANDSAAQFSRRRHAETCHWGVVWQREDRHEATGGAKPPLIDALIIGAPGDSLRWTQRLVGPHESFIRPTAFGPWRDDASAPGGHFSCSCGPESHGSVCDGGCSVETCASWSSLNPVFQSGLANV